MLHSARRYRTKSITLQRILGLFIDADFLFFRQINIPTNKIDKYHGSLPDYWMSIYSMELILIIKINWISSW